MPGSITLPQVVLDLEEEDRKRYEALKPPSSIVIRYGYMKMVAELPYGGDGKPGCGSKIVARTGRGIELGEMLTTTCGNGGCGKSVSRKEMLEYIDNSGGRDYPFTTQGKILRIATPEDLAEQARLDGGKMPMIRFSKQLIAELDLPMKLVDVEMLLGGERVIFHYVSEVWIDFRELVRRLAAEYQTRIEMHQVNARDEARLVADYEKCGQHCCCKQFLKVLKPVSMRSAKVQKATLDPTKISGRCGRLMCCLRYEDETYETLRKKLPNRQSRCMTEEGPGTVIDTQILTQLVLVRLDNAPAPAAFPLENITILKKGDPNFIPPPPPEERRAPDRAPAGDRRGPNDRAPAGDRQQGREQPGLASERTPGGERPQGGDRQPSQDRPQGDRAPSPDRSSGYRSGPGRAGQPRDGGAAPSGGGDRQQPRRPKPGAPLNENEIEAREGAPIGEPPHGHDGSSTGDSEAPSDLDEDGGFDASHSGADHAGDGSGPGGDPQGSNTAAEQNQNQGQGPDQPGQGGGRRRRRRRRRGRGRGQGGDQGGQGQGGGGGPSPSSGPPSVQ